LPTAKANKSLCITHTSVQEHDKHNSEQHQPLQHPHCIHIISSEAVKHDKHIGEEPLNTIQAEQYAGIQ